MKRFIALLMGCSLALGAIALAQQPPQPQQPQQPQEQASPTQQQGGKGRHQAKEQATQPAGQQPQPRQRGGKKAAMHENANAGTTNPATTNAEATPQAGRHANAKEGRRGKAGAKETNANATTPNESAGAAGATASAPPTGKQAKQGKHGRNKANQPATTNASAAPAAPAANAAASPAQSATAGVQANTANANAQGRGGRGRKVDPQTVQNIKSQHASFRAQPKPQQAPAVTFNQSYRIQGAEQWQGPQYGVFRSYHPEMHDQGWYRSHYTRIELIGGGYYYWNNGYWFPAWGYSPAESYYAWDGPIYVGQRAERPDQVIADVQAVLQQEGYYTGEVDGLLGPLTRQALTDYQRENGLYTTAAIDEPTLQSLGLS